jgi:hypothetical protein
MMAAMSPTWSFGMLFLLLPLAGLVAALAVLYVIRYRAKARQRGFPLDQPPRDRDTP